MLVQNFNKGSCVAQKGFIGWDFDIMCFRKWSFFERQKPCRDSLHTWYHSVFERHQTAKNYSLLTGISKMILNEGVEGRNWSLHNLIKAGVCKRPIHLPGVFEEHLEATSQRLQPSSPTPAQQGTGTLHGSFPYRSQYNGTVREHWLELPPGLGTMLRPPGLIRLWKGWEQRWQVPGSHILLCWTVGKCCSWHFGRSRRDPLEVLFWWGEFFPSCLLLSVWQEEAEPCDIGVTEVVAFGMK